MGETRGNFWAGGGQVVTLPWVRNLEGSALLPSVLLRHPWCRPETSQPLNLFRSGARNRQRGLLARCVGPGKAEEGSGQQGPGTESG